ncbi:MAG: phosphoribosylformylglycinamidine synthase subunit PurQ [Ignavibacteria bacterium]
MKFGVVIFPGSNCDYDTYYLLREILGVKTEFLFHKENSLNNCDVIILPGGFSYGDYLRSGAIARFSPIMKEVIKFAHEGGTVIGICNGFQILCESGLLPGVLSKNSSLKFQCFDQQLKIVNNKTRLTNLFQENEVVTFPIAHGEGNYIIDEDGLKELYDNNQIILKYCDKYGNINEESNPNGSMDNIAGICNKEGNVFGLMPHPERCGESILGNTDGIKIFKSILNYLRS